MMKYVIKALILFTAIFHASAMADSILTITNDGKVGIGTDYPEELVEVSGGNLKIGYELVQEQCAGAGTDCYAACPADKYVLGGGCKGGYGAGNIQNSHPSGSTQWRCRMTGTFQETHAYAICANIR